MVFSNDLIKNILEDHLWDKEIYQDGKFQCGFDELVEGITVELNAIADTERRLRDIKDEEQMLQEKHMKACADLQMAENEITAQCRHRSTTHHRNESDNCMWTTCDICRKEL